MNTRKALIVTAVALLALTGCSQSTQAGEIGVVVDDYAVIPTDPKVLGCMQPETEEFHIVNDVYRYPARQISWDATGGTGAERGPYTVVSNRAAPAELNVPVVVTLDLTSDCEQLTEFHRNLGTKYEAWLTDEGKVSDGWIALLNYVVGQPLEVALTRVAQQYSWQEIWNDEAIRAEFEQTLQEELPSRIVSRSGGGEFFSNLQVTVGKPDPVSEDLKKAIEAEQTSIATANAARLAAEAQKETAIAETEVARQEALQQQAKISGYPNVEAYLQAECIAKGCNPYQPTYVVPQQIPQ